MMLLLRLVVGAGLLASSLAAHGPVDKRHAALAAANNAVTPAPLSPFSSPSARRLNRRDRDDEAEDVWDTLQQFGDQFLLCPLDCAGYLGTTAYCTVKWALTLFLDVPEALECLCEGWTDKFGRCASCLFEANEDTDQGAVAVKLIADLNNWCASVDVNGYTSMPVYEQVTSMLGDLTSGLTVTFSDATLGIGSSDVAEATATEEVETTEEAAETTTLPSSTTTDLSSTIASTASSSISLTRTLTTEIFNYTTTTFTQVRVAGPTSLTRLDWSQQSALSRAALYSSIAASALSAASVSSASAASAAATAVSSTTATTTTGAGGSSGAERLMLGGGVVLVGMVVGALLI
ncbi:hypothetical protein JCM8547_006854 [Rhodosporidiobolus lusitaniae]